MGNKNKPAEDALIKNLVEQMDRELEKPFEEQDMDYIEECSRRLQEIAGERYDPEPADRKESIEKIKRLGNRTSRKKVLIKRLGVAAAAACLVLVMMGGGIAWADGDYSRLPFGDLLYRMAFILRPGEAADIGGDTFYKSVTYSTIEEFLEAQDTLVLYPTCLPEKVELKEIRFYKKDTGEKEMYCVFSDREIQFYVFLYDKYSNLDEVFAGEEPSEINGVKYYIRETENGMVNAVFNREGYSYSVTAGNLEDLMGILKGLEMKG